MPLNILADFFSIINPSFFDAAAVVFFITFIIWELPRSMKIIAEEYTKGAYPEYGRVVDFALLSVGILSLAYLYLFNALDRVVVFLKTPGITAIFLILMVAIPLIIALGFFKRFFGRMEKHESITIFLVHALLDMMHTIFYICLAIIFIPAFGYLVLGVK